MKYKNKLDFFIKTLEEKNEKEKMNETLQNEKKQKKSYMNYIKILLLYILKKKDLIFLFLYLQRYIRNKIYAKS